MENACFRNGRKARRFLCGPPCERYAIRGAVLPRLRLTQASLPLLQPTAFCLLLTPTASCSSRPGGPKEFSPPREPWDSIRAKNVRAAAGAKDKGRGGNSLQRGEALIVRSGMGNIARFAFVLCAASERVHRRVRSSVFGNGSFAPPGLVASLRAALPWLAPWAKVFRPLRGLIGAGAVAAVAACELFASYLPPTTALGAMFRRRSRRDWPPQRCSRRGLASSTPSDWGRPHHQEGFGVWA